MNSSSSSKERINALTQAIARVAESIPAETIRIMEVCGTHTMAIFRAGLRALLPSKVKLISGPGCPVCVTPGGFVDAAIEIGRQADVVLTTFGDMMKVPGSVTSLEKAKAQGVEVLVVYSPSDALAAASRRPDKKVVFLGVGFETTAPLVAQAVIDARDQELQNFFLLSAHKLVPPALSVLAEAEQCAVDAFICPGHVSAVIGCAPYDPIAKDGMRPCVIDGFEPLDVLLSVFMLLRQLKEGRSEVEVEYERCVDREGNPAAVQRMMQAFEACEADWRGLGRLPDSGLELRSQYAELDATEAFAVTIPEVPEPPGCRCAEVIMGVAEPTDCQLFGKACTPASAVGPCMVSSEGVCSAYFKYARRGQAHA